MRTVVLLILLLWTSFSLASDSVNAQKSDVKSAHVDLPPIVRTRMNKMVLAALSPTQKIFPNELNAVREHQFGYTFAFDGDLLAVGAPFLSFGGAVQGGGVYLFERDVGGANNWGQVARLIPSDTQNIFGFRGEGQDDANAGIALAVSGDTVAVGAPGFRKLTGGGDPQTAEEDMGAVFLFQRDEGGTDAWGQAKLILPEGGLANDRFGQSVTLEGDTLVIASPNHLSGPNSRLRAHWRFDGDTLDAGPFSHHGTAVGAVSYATGVFGNAIDLNGIDQYVDLSTNILPDQFSCSIAFFVSTDSFTAGRSTIFGADMPDQNGVEVELVSGANVAEFGLPVSPVIQPQPDLPADTSWVHIAFTYDQSTETLSAYADGVPQGDATVGSLQFPPCGSDAGTLFSIGAVDTNGAGNIAQYHDGRIDELRIYDRALRADEVAQLVAGQETVLRGSFYVYERNNGGTNNWGEVTKVDGISSASNTDEVDLSGDTLAVRTSNGVDTALHIHERNQGGTNAWQSLLEVMPPPSTGGFRGFAEDNNQVISLSGNTLVGVGIEGTPTVNGPAIWLFDGADASPWSYQRTLAGCPGGGAMVATDGQTIAARAGTASEVCVYEQDFGGTNNWGLARQIPNPLGQTAQNQYGNSLAVQGQDLAIGAKQTDRPAGNVDAGAMFLHQQDLGGASNWGELRQIIAGDTIAGSGMGRSVDRDGSRLIIGVNGDDTSQGVFNGAAYVFEQVGEDWQFVAELLGTNDGGAGFSVGISGDTAITSNFGDDRAHVFQEQFGSWTEVAQLQVPDPGFFGFTVDLQGDTAAIPESSIRNPTSGNFEDRLNVFRRDQGGVDNWGLVASVFTDNETSFFGRSVDISDDETLIAVGADRSDDNGENDSGAVYIFERDLGGPNAWGLRVKLVPALLQAGDRLGRAVSIDNQRLVATAPDASSLTNIQTGKALIFDRDEGGVDNWGLVDVVEGSIQLDFQTMGVSVALEGDRFIAGAPSFGGALSIQEGVSYIFERDPTDNSWHEIAAIRADDGAIGNFFGRGVDITGTTVIVGSPNDNELGESAGAGYIFELPDLEISSVTVPSQAEAGDTVSITITPGNTGDGDAQDLVLSADLPNVCATLNSTSVSAGWIASNPSAGVLRVSLPIAAIASGASPPQSVLLDTTATLPISASCAPFTMDFNVDGAVTTPTPDFFQENNASAAQLTLVEPVNQPPTGIIPDLDFPAGTQLTINFNDYFTDPNGDSMTFSASDLPASILLNSTTGIATGTTTASDFNNSPFSISVTATDMPAGASSTPANFTLTLTNAPPTERFPLSAYTTVVGEDLLIDVSPHFTDADGQALQFSLSGSTAYTIGNFGQAGLIRGVATTTQLQQSPLTLNLTVADGFGQQIVRSLVITIEDQLAPQFDFQRFFPALQQPWYFSDIQDMEAAPDGTVYLGDAERGKVLRFSKDGLLVTQWGQLGSDPGQFSFLSLQLAVAPDGLVYTASGSRLQIFGKNGEFVSDTDLVDDIIDLTVDSNNRLYLLLSDGLSQRVEIRSADQLNLIVDTIDVSRPPASIAVTDGGRVYVSMRSSGSPTNNDQIVPYDPPGYAPGSPIATADADDLTLDASGTLFAVGDGDSTVRGYDTSGALQVLNDVSTAGGPALQSLTFGQQDRIFISNGASVFGVEGNTDMRLFGWQSASDDVGRFRRPLDVSRDGSDNLYVVEAEQSRVQRFSADGDIQAGWSLQQAIADPGNAQVYIHATGFSPTRVLVSTGSALELYDASGALIAPNPFDPGGLTQPGPIDETATGNMVVSDTGGAGTQVWVINSGGVIQDGPWTAPNCQATGMTAGINNLIYLLCEPGLAAREIQVFSQAGVKIANATIALPEGNPRGLAADNNGRIFLLNTENEIDLGFGITSSDSKIRVYRSDGVELGQLGTSGYSAGRFDFAGEVAGIDIGSFGELILAEPGNNRVQVFDRQTVSRNTKAIVVAGGGDYPENFLWEATQVNANNAYDKLIYQGFTADRIQYLHPDPNLDLDGNPSTQEVDGDPSLLNLEEAITVWAADADNLVLYLADHGDKEVFRLNPQEIIDSGTLSSWVSQLQDSEWPSRTQPPVGNNGWITVVYEACESGTFQDNLAPQNSLATNKRVVITTSSSDQNASFIAQGLLSFSYQFWINVFNGDNVRDAFELASATISDAYPQQSPILSLIDGGSRVSNLDTYFDNGGTNASFAGRFVGNGTTNSFMGPEVISPAASLVSGSTGLLEVQTVLSGNDVSRVWAIIEPPGYQVRDSENPILELPTIDLEATCTSGADYCAEFAGFTTVGDYRIQFLAQDIFGTVSALSGSEATLSVGNPLRNKAALFIADGGDERGAARAANGDFAYQALLRQDFVNDLDPDTTGVSALEDEIRYFTQGQFVGADIGTPGPGELNNLLTSGFADANTQHLAIIIMADFDTAQGGLIIPGQTPLTVANLNTFLTNTEAVIQGKVVVILEGDGTGAIIPQLSANNGRRLLLSSTSPGETAKLLGAGGISFSKFFWNAIRDGFSLGTSFRLASQAISQGVGVQNPLLDDNGNGISNDPSDQIVSRNFFLGPGLARAGNGPLVGRLAADITIASANINSASILAENVSSLSDVAVSVMGSVSVPGTQLQVGEFVLSEVGGVQKGQQLINLGDFQGQFDGFIAAGDYDVSVFAVDDKGNPSTPQKTRVRKTAGGDIFEVDNGPSASTPLIRDAAPQRHTLHLVDDEDWLIFLLSDSAVRVLDLSFSDLDPGLRVELELFDDSRLSNDQAAAVLSQVIDPGLTRTDVAIPDTLAAGRYFARIRRQSFNPQVDSDPSPGYTLGLSSPFGTLGGLLRGKVVDSSTGSPVGLARVAAITADGAFCGTPPCEAGAVPTCDRASCGNQGGFLMFLNQGSYDVEVSAPGYQSVTISNFAVQPGGTTLVIPDPIALVPEATAMAPSVFIAGASTSNEVSADLNGTINANGSQTTGRFLIGLSAQDLKETNPSFLVVGSADQPVSSVATGLTCDTNYTVRLTAENAGGQAESSDMTLTTALCGSTGLDVIFGNGFE